jgi:hypothetical protein
MSKPTYIVTPNKEIPPLGFTIITNGKIRNSDWCWDWQENRWAHPTPEDYNCLGSDISCYIAVARKKEHIKVYVHLAVLIIATEVKNSTLLVDLNIERNVPKGIKLYQRVVLKDSALYTYFYIQSSEIIGWKIWVQSVQKVEMPKI